MRVIVTGATGFLGARLALRLKTDGWEVAGVGRDPERGRWLAQRGISFFRLDLTAPGGGDALRAFGPADLFVHAGGLSSAFGRRRDFLSANVTGTRTALELARRASVRRFVFISSPSVYARFCDQFDLPETAPLPRPLTPYADSKARAETLVLGNADLSPIVLRPRALYGPGDTALLPRLLRAAQGGSLPLLRGGNALTNLTHVDDAVEAILAAGRAGPKVGGEVFNVAGSEVLRLTDVVDRVAERAGLKISWRRVPWTAALALARLSESLARLKPGMPEPAVTVHGLTAFAFSQTLDTSKARNLLGFVPQVLFEDGLERTLGAEAKR